MVTLLIDPVHFTVFVDSTDIYPTHMSEASLPNTGSDVLEDEKANEQEYDPFEPCTYL